MLRKIVRLALFCIILPLFPVYNGEQEVQIYPPVNQTEGTQEDQGTGLETEDIFDSGYKITPMEKVQLKSLSRKEKLIWAIRMSSKYTFL